MDAESARIRQEEMLRAENAREQLLGIANTPMSFSNLNAFVPAVVENAQFTPDAEPYSALRANQPQSIVGGMFSPEISRAAEMEYMMKRQRAMQDEALAYAQLTPMQQAQFGFYRGGQQLGDALGGALGGKDPQLQMIGLQQQILSELDPSNPEQNLMVAQKYARTAPELSMKIAENARKSMSEMALTTQRLREKQGADPFEQLLRTGKYTPASMAAYKLSKNVADLREVDSPDKIPAKIQEAQTVAISKGFPKGTPEHDAEVVKYLERPEKQLSLTNDRDAISAELYDNKPFAQLTPAQKAVVNRRVEEEGQARAKAGAPSSGIKEFKDIPKLRADIISTVKPFRDTVNATDFALENLGLSIKQNNFSAFNAARVQLAKSLAGGDLSQKEIQAAGGDPSIIGGLVDMASTAFSGTPSTDTQEKIKATIKAIRKVALQKGRAELDSQRTLAKRSNFTDEDFDLASDIPEFRKKPDANPQAFDAEKEKRYQEWKAKQKGKAP